MRGETVSFVSSWLHNMSHSSEPAAAQPPTQKASETKVNGKWTANLYSAFQTCGHSKHSAVIAWHSPIQAHIGTPTVGQPCNRRLPGRSWVRLDVSFCDTSTLTRGGASDEPATLLVSTQPRLPPEPLPPMPEHPAHCHHPLVWSIIVTTTLSR